VFSFGFSQNIKFKRLSIDEGLSAVTVKTVFQDSRDFIWIGTQDGLNRYDGYHVKTFKNNQYSKTTISSNDINCLFEDKNRILYIGTNDGGLSVFNKQTELFTSFKSGLGAKTLSNNSIRHITDLNDNELLIATEDGLNVFNKTTKQFSQINCSNNSSTSNLKYIFRDSKNRIFVASYGNGLYEYNPATKTLFNYPIIESSLENNINFVSEKMNMRCITEVDGNIWCGSEKGILVFDPIVKKFIKIIDFGNDSRYNNRVVSFAKDQNSDFIWIGTWGGLVKYNVHNFTYSLYNNNELDQSSLSDNKISYLLSDKNKNLWIGTQDKGINIYFPSSIKFPLYNSNNGLTSDYIYSVIQASDKTLWVGTENGLFTLKNKDAKFNDLSDILTKYEAQTVLSLLEDKDGNIWIGTYGQGIIIYNPKTKTSRKTLSDNSKIGTITKIIQDKNNTIWAGTFAAGLFAINPHTLEYKQYTESNGLSSNAIYCIFENKKDNTIWVGTLSGGICILNFTNDIDKPLVNIFKHIENKNSISSNSVNNIYKDDNGIYWIGTSNGLNKFNFETKKFTVYIEKDGLPNSYIYDVIPDKKNNLWLPSNFGLTKFNPNISNENGSAFKNYNTKDGIQAREFNQGASFLCKDGKILVGGVSGLNYFDPNEIKENTVTPNSYIYSFGRQGKEVKTDTSILFKKFIELSYKENYFTFEFITLDYVSPEKNRFMYKLEGYDHEWSSPSDVRYASYTELPGGSYTFKVKATNSDGVWTETPYEITIKVIPPWWKTTLFYIISIISLTALVFGFISYRTSSIKKENKLLENKVTERTKELAEKNRDITSSIEYAKRIQEAILPSKDLIFSKLKNVFILYKPKDIVSGDFYWFGEKDDFKIIAVVDCTGHGVPGAFMSMIGHNLLNQIVAEKGFSDPGLILEQLHKGVQSALKQGHNDVDTNDGMDVSLLAINTETRKCLWAGAFRSLVIINNEGDLEKTEGNKYPVGGAQLDSERIFTTHIRDLNKGDCIYMSTDGYADQFGGSKGKKFMVKQFHDNLTIGKVISSKLTMYWSLE
jgi:ligand-binding sensor domain-containing protein